MWLAVLLHLICDAAAGGIAWLYPLQNKIIGGPYIPLPLWFLSDVACVIVTIRFQYWINQLEMKRDADAMSYWK
ncbi:MAG: hypothetical protein ACI9R3_001179 [Verrucomicrobiales bacterium]|jgi:hypothetical protein